MAATTRHYKLTEKGKEGFRLVRAGHPNQVLTHAIDKSRFKVAVATDEDYEAALEKGIRIEKIESAGRRGRKKATLAAVEPATAQAAA
jgi:hypothetical protein